ncbi:MAG: YjbF family lipoprotein [Marinomonas sp.]
MSTFPLSLDKCCLFLCVFFMSGCSSNFQTAIESAKLAIDQSKGVDITKEYIQATPYSSAVVMVNNASPILMILAFAEKNSYNNNYRLTWVSSDKGAIVTENGRIIHTSGLNSANLESLHSIENDLPWIGKEEQWSAVYDWSPGYRYNFSATVKAKYLGKETITTDIWESKADYWSEAVYFDGLNYRLTNKFWVVPNDHTSKPRVVKSIQYVGPNMDKIEMLIMKHFTEPYPASELVDSSATVHISRSMGKGS